MIDVERTSSAFDITDDVGELQNDGKNGDEEPIDSCDEREQARDEKDDPNEREDDENDPEDLGLVGIDEGVLLVRLENPFVRTVRFDVIPPSQACQQASTHILRRPKIKCQE